MKQPRVILWILGAALLAACGTNPESKGKPEIKSDLSTTIDAVEPIGGDWDLVRRVESPHPYENNYGQRWVVTGSADATEMSVVFDRFELENGYDLVFLSGAGGANETRHTGDKTDHQLVIPGNKVEISLESDYSITKWGFSFRVFERKPCICIEIYAPVCGVDGQTYDNSCFAGCDSVQIAHAGECQGSNWLTVPRTLESSHPYGNNFNNTWTISEGGASHMRVHFTQVDVERGYDHLRVLDGNDNVVADYTGTQRDFHSPSVAGDTIKIQLVTDYSVVRYGFKIDSLDVMGGCASDADCGAGHTCEQIVCVRAPCFAMCTPVGGTYTDVTVQQLDADPQAWSGQLVRVVAEPTARLPSCTRRYCPANEPCCNMCSASFNIGTGIALRDSNDAGYGCNGNSCNWSSNCEPFSFENAGLYELEGRFEHGPYGSKKLLVDNYSAADCQSGGCSGQLCTNGGGAISTCEWRPEYACYRSATCEAQGSGHCAWTMTPALQQCLATANSPTFEATDVPIDIPDDDRTGITSTLEALGGHYNSLRVSVDISHPYRGDLVVTLVAPNGQEAVLHDHTGGSANDVVLEDFDVSAAVGTDVAGRWSLRVQDMAAWDTGTLNSWSISAQ